ncbi:MAG: hypothetical protein HYY93_07340 [Planctomycetes bacterium]|nr:hypothetical protein [Planctomycetota bacterium]
MAWASGTGWLSVVTAPNSDTIRRAVSSASVNAPSRSARSADSMSECDVRSRSALARRSLRARHASRRSGYARPPAIARMAAVSGTTTFRCRTIRLQARYPIEGGRARIGSPWRYARRSSRSSEAVG